MTIFASHQGQQAAALYPVWCLAVMMAWPSVDAIEVNMLTTLFKKRILG